MHAFLIWVYEIRLNQGFYQLKTGIPTWQPIYRSSWWCQCTNRICLSCVTYIWRALCSKSLKTCILLILMCLCLYVHYIIDSQHALLCYDLTLSVFFHLLNFQSVKENCQGEYVVVDPANIQCVKDLAAINDVRKLLFIGVPIIYTLFIIFARRYNIKSSFSFMSIQKWLNSWVERMICSASRILMLQIFWNLTAL